MGKSNDTTSNRSSSSRIIGKQSRARESAIDSSNDDGTNDREQSSIVTENRELRIDATSDSSQPITDASANRQFKLADGHYFKPNGEIDRIPYGYYLRPDGRLARRRKRRDNDTQSTDGNNNSDRTETSAEERISEPSPIRVGKSKSSAKIKKLTETQHRLTMLAMLAVALTALFSTLALFFGKHWNLDTEESNIFADQLNQALMTLPQKSYETIIAIIEKWVPWINLTFTVYAILLPRIEETGKQIKSRSKGNYSTVDNGIHGERKENNSFTDFASLGWNG